MAMKIPETRAEVDALKGNIGFGHNQAAKQIRARAGSIAKTYNANSAETRADQAARSQIANAQAAREDAGMLAAARNLGIAPVKLGASRGDAVRGRLLKQRAGDATGRTRFLDIMRDTAIGRNAAQGAAFEEAGRQMNADLEHQFQEYLAQLAAMAASGGGGGGGRGGGGGGGNYWEDEPLVEYPGTVPSMEKGVVRGLAATSRRLTQQGAAHQKAGAPSMAEYARRLRQGMLKNRYK